MLAVAMTLHVLGTIIWVGGMFFAHMALRPTAVELLEPPQRLPLMYRTLGRFFFWVWISVVSIIASGYWVFFMIYQGKMGLYVHVMQGIGLVMAALFFFLYFFPFQRMGAALNANDFPSAAKQLNTIRGIVTINLVLGLLVSAIATTRLF